MASKKTSTHYRKEAKSKQWPCEKISELSEFSSGRQDECLDNLKWNSCKWQSMHYRNVAGNSYITQVLVCIPQRIGNSWSLAKKTLWISVLSLTFYNPLALRWLAPNTRVIRSLTRPPITRRARVEYPTRSTPTGQAFKYKQNYAPSLDDVKYRT